MNQEGRTVFDELKIKLKNNKYISIFVLGMIGVSLLWWPLDIWRNLFSKDKKNSDVTIDHSNVAYRDMINIGTIINVNNVDSATTKNDQITEKVDSPFLYEVKAPRNKGIGAFTYDGKEILLGGHTKIRINRKSNDTVFISAIIRNDTFDLIVQNFMFRNSEDFSIIRSNENSFLPSHYVNMRDNEFINFRNRPLNQNEIDIVNQDRYRNHKPAISIDDSTFCFGLNDGMPVELINKLEKFSQIKVEFSGKTYTGFIANKVHGISTLRPINN